MLNSLVGLSPFPRFFAHGLSSCLSLVVLDVVVRVGVSSINANMHVAAVLAAPFFPPPILVHFLFYVRDLTCAGGVRHS